MNALFFFAGYNHRRNSIERFAVTVPDGPDDRLERAAQMMRKDYPEINRWTGTFVCLTNEEVFKELW